MHSTEATEEAKRLLQICNACRYCEGYCAVFPAMELRRAFTTEDVSYLANLCHNCRGCYYACQYAPPHEFQLNLPRTLAVVRGETYVEYAWPRPLAALFKKNGTILSVATALGIALVLVLTSALSSPQSLFTRQVGTGSFYRVISENAMIGVALASTLFSSLVLAIGAIRFWRDTGGGNVFDFPALRVAIRDALSLRYLGGGAAGGGCNDQSESFSQTRRRYHHALFYGFMLCLASTTVAGIYDHIMGWPAPYAFFSAPVLLGTAGGLAMTVGCIGLMWLKYVADPEPSARNLIGSDYALLTQLLLAAVTGLALLVLRDSAVMGLLLAVHLGVIFSFFVMMPYSKFVHGIYRSFALLRNAQEQQAAPPSQAGH